MRTLGVLAMGLALLASSGARAGERAPASSRKKALSAPHLNHPVPSAPDWVVGVEVASKSQPQGEPAPRPVLMQPEFIQSSAATAPANQRDHGYFRDHLWIVHGATHQR